MPLHDETVVTPGRDTRLRIQRPTVAPHLVEVVVLDALPIADAAPPHLVWDAAAQKATRSEPAFILHDAPLRLRVKLLGGAASGPATVVAEVKVKGGAPLTLKSAPRALPPPGEAWEVVLESAGPFTSVIAAHVLEARLTLDAGGKAQPIHTEPARLRVYTGHRAPIQNTPYDSPQPRVCKAHLEHVCRWANGASKNIGQGAASIAHQVDNQLRHYVHPRDWPAPDHELASVYAAGSAPPLNYGDLEGGPVGGTRRVSSLYYPPLEPRQAYEEYYPHYQDNFGWRLLDNPTHTGGRCNQQAALICELLGLLGIKAEVYYLQRVGVGRRTGRPCRQFFNCYQGGQFWNFHGIVKVQMDDGTFHMYDGSFSSPPNRKHGDEKWAIGEKGPFIYSWSPWWQYEDRPARVPPEDVPTTWKGVP